MHKTLRWLGVVLLPVLMLGLVSCESSDSGDDGAFPRSMNVSANSESGTTFTAPEAGSYGFTVTGGAYSFTNPGVEWHTQLRVYLNKPIEWGGGDHPEPVHFTAVMGKWTSLPSQAEAEAAGIGTGIAFDLPEGGTVTFIVPGRKGWFSDNVGSVRLRIDQSL